MNKKINKFYSERLGEIIMRLCLRGSILIVFFSSHVNADWIMYAEDFDNNKLYYYSKLVKKKNEKVQVLTRVKLRVPTDGIGSYQELIEINCIKKYFINLRLSAYQDSDWNELYLTYKLTEKQRVNIPQKSTINKLAKLVCGL